MNNVTGAGEFRSLYIQGFGSLRTSFCVRHLKRHREFDHVKLGTHIFGCCVDCSGSRLRRRRRNSSLDCEDLVCCLLGLVSRLAGCRTSGSYLNQMNPTLPRQVESNRIALTELGFPSQMSRFCRGDVSQEAIVPCLILVSTFQSTQFWSQSERLVER